MTFTRRLAGLAALVALAGLLAGVPALLWWLAQPYLPTAIPNLDEIVDALTSRDDGSLIVVILFIAAWIAWLYLAVALLIEIWAAVRRVPAPHIPGFSLPQGMAHRLVAIALLAFIAAPALAGTSHATPGTTPEPAPITSTSTAPVQTDTTGLPSSGATIATATATATALEGSRETVSHVVGPGDTLMGLASQYLGDGDRYVEIFEANQGMVQSNGILFTDPDLIVDGTILSILLDTTTPPTATASEGSRETVSHVVGPGDTLMGLASQYLGDGDRYVEIFEANQGMVQSNGTLFTDPDLIVDGTILSILLDTTTPPPAEKVNEEPPTAADLPTIQPTPSSLEATPPATPTSPASTRPTAPAAIPASTAAAAEAPEQQQAVIHSAQDVTDEDAIGVRTAFGVGALMASGVIGLIGSRRLLQRRQRHRGVPLVMPEGAAATIEHQLRAVGDPLAIAEVDLALRSLALHCRDAGTALPEIRVARLTGTTFEVYLSEPAQLPEPWVGIAAGTLWSYQADTTDNIDQPLLHEIPAPYPALVTVGQDLEDAHILVDLETVGSIGVTGPHDEAEEVLAAMAIELATSCWADDLTVTMVGAFPEMEDVLQTGRIRYLPTAGRLFDELRHRADNDRLAMKLEHAKDLHHARISAVAPSTWFPEIVLLTQPLTALQQAELDQLMNELPRVAIASVAITDKAGEWSITLNGRDEAAILHPMELAIVPQRIAASAYRHVLDVVDIATNAQPIHNEMSPAAITSMLDEAVAYLHSNDPVPDAQTTTDDFPPDADDDTKNRPHDPRRAMSIDEPFPAVEHLDDMKAIPDTPAQETTAAAATPPAVGPVDGQPYLQLLGPVEVIGAEGPVVGSRKNRLTEYLSYLVLNQPAASGAIDDAIWPNRSNQNNATTRDPATSRLRKWLGTTETGDLRLNMNTFGIEDVGSDWADFRTLTTGSIDDIPREHLQAAVDLVRGTPFKGVSVRSYGWAEPVQQEMISRVVDACYDLATRQLVDGDYLACEATLAKGIDIEPGDEQLWRMRILAAHARHNQAAVDEATSRLFAQLEAFECSPEPATNQFLRKLSTGAAMTDLMELI